MSVIFFLKFFQGTRIVKAKITVTID